MSIFRGPNGGVLWTPSGRKMRRGPAPVDPSLPTYQTIPMPIMFPVDQRENPSYWDGWEDLRDGGSRVHRAVDIYPESSSYVTYGVEIYSPVDGVIDSWMPGYGGQSVNVNSGGGYQLRVNTHNGELRYHMSHFGPDIEGRAHEAFAPGIAPGVTVQKGDLLGWMGESGSTASGQHLHIEIRDLVPNVLDDPYASYDPSDLGMQAGPRYNPYPSLNAAESNLEPVVPPPPTNLEAQFVWSPTNPNPGEEVTFDGSSSIDAVSWVWDDAVNIDDPLPQGTFALGDGEIITFTFQNPGIKTVRLMVQDAEGNTDTRIQEIEVAEPVTVHGSPGSLVVVGSIAGDAPVDDPVSHGHELTLSNTGSDDPQTLTHHVGQFNSSHHGQTIQNLFIEAQGAYGLGAALRIQHNNVTVNNVYVLLKRPASNPGYNMTAGNYYPSVVRVESGLSGVTFNRATMDGDRAIYGRQTGTSTQIREDANQGNNGMKVYSPITVTRSIVKSVRQGIQFWQGAFPSHVYETYLYDNWRNAPGVSTTGVSYRCHTGSSNALVKHIERCRFEMSYHTCAWTLTSEAGPPRNFDIHNNYVNGIPNGQNGSVPQVGARFGRQATNTGNHKEDMRDIRATGNRAGGDFSFNIAFGWLDQNSPGVVWSNNRWHVSNTLITNTYPNG